MKTEYSAILCCDRETPAIEMEFAMEFQDTRSLCNKTLRGRIRDQKLLAIAIAWCTQLCSN